MPTVTSRVFPEKLAHRRDPRSLFFGLFYHVYGLLSISLLLDFYFRCMKISNYILTNSNMCKVYLFIFAFIYVSNFLKISFSAYTEDGNELMFQVRNTFSTAM